MEILIAVWLFFILFCLMNAYRIHRFSKFMRSEIDRVGSARMTGNRDVKYPDIAASYDNLKWYDVFNYNFERLVVYDKF